MGWGLTCLQMMCIVSTTLSRPNILIPALSVSQSWVPRANHTPVLGVPVVGAPDPFLVEGVGKVSFWTVDVWIFAAKLLNIAETNSVKRRLMHKPNRVQSNLDSLRRANDVGAKCLPTLLILGEFQSKEFLNKVFRMQQQSPQPGNRPMQSSDFQKPLRTT